MLRNSTPDDIVITWEKLRSWIFWLFIFWIIAVIFASSIYSAIGKENDIRDKRWERFCEANPMHDYCMKVREHSEDCAISSRYCKPLPWIARAQ